MILRPDKEPIVVFRNPTVGQVVGVSTLKDNYNGDPDDLDSQRDVKNGSRKSQTIF
jgi:hypothetical protein